jgi:predicted Rossmann-fold nucleotide-binding protein
MGSEYWRGLLDWIRGPLIDEATVNQAEIDLLRISDDPVEACDIIDAYVSDRDSRPGAETAPETQVIDAAEVTHTTHGSPEKAET